MCCPDERSLAQMVSRSGSSRRAPRAAGCINAIPLQIDVVGRSQDPAAGSEFLHLYGGGRRVKQRWGSWQRVSTLVRGGSARTYIGARWCGAGGLVGALAAAHSPTGAGCLTARCIGSSPQAVSDRWGLGRSHVVVIASSGCFRCEQDVVAAAGDFAGDGQPCPAAAATADGAGVEVVVGAAVAVTVVGGLDQCPAEMP